MRLVIAFVLATALLLSIVGCEKSSTREGGESIQILSHQLECDWVECEVVGTIRNVSSHDCEMVVVYVEFYDANNVMIDRSSDWLWDLHEGQTAKFEVSTWELDEDGMDTIYPKLYRLS